MNSHDEEIPYRSPGMSSLLPVRDEASSTDEGNLDTLQVVRAELQKALDSLNKDFNAFQTDQNKTPAERAAILLHDIDVRQGVYDIVAPLLDAVDSSMAAVNAKYKER